MATWFLRLSCICHRLITFHAFSGSSQPLPILLHERQWVSSESPTCLYGEYKNEHRILNPVQFLCRFLRAISNDISSIITGYSQAHVLMHSPYCILLLRVFSGSIEGSIGTNQNYFLFGMTWIFTWQPAHVRFSPKELFIRVSQKWPRYTVGKLWFLSNMHPRLSYKKLQRYLLARTFWVDPSLCTTFNSNILAAWKYEAHANV